MTCKIFWKSLLTILIAVIISNCALQGGFIPIHTIRIEDIQVQKIFRNNADVEKITARWQKRKIDLLSQPQNQVMATYSLVDDYTYKGRSSNDARLIGTIYSLGNNSGMSWKDAKKSDKKNNDDLVFIIEPEVREDKFVDMVYIPGGSFNMGSNMNKEEQPVHQITVSGFYLDKYEVTVAQFREFCKATRRTMPPQPYWSEDRNPVINVSWNDALALRQVET